MRKKRAKDLRSRVQIEKPYTYDKVVVKSYNIPGTEEGKVTQIQKYAIVNVSKINYKKVKKEFYNELRSQN